MHDPRRRSIHLSTAGRLLVAGTLGFFSACSSDDAGPQAPSGPTADVRDAALYLPGEGTDETPPSDITARRLPSTRSERVTQAISELQRLLGDLTRRDGGLALPPTSGSEATDAGEDAAPGVGAADASPPDEDDLDAGAPEDASTGEDPGEPPAEPEAGAPAGDDARDDAGSDAAALDAG